MQKAADLGFTFYVHPEVEFFLLRSRPGPDALLPEPIDAEHVLVVGAQAQDRLTALLGEVLPAL